MVPGWQRMDEEQIAGCSADRRCRERSELEGVCDAPLSVSKARIKYRPSWVCTLGEIFPIAMGRRPITISKENARVPTQEGRALKSPPFEP